MTDIVRLRKSAKTTTSWKLSIEQLETRTMLSATPIEIDIEPNSINAFSNGKVAVAILSTAELDASTEVNPATLTFGHSGSEESVHHRGNGTPNCAAEDANGDGLTDLVCHFLMQDADFRKGDTEGFLKGETVAGDTIEGEDSVRIIHNGQFSEILIFGDSLSDTGNVNTLTGGLFAGPVHFDGRYSNGPLWVEKLAHRMRLPEPTPSLTGGTDYAYAGAKTGSGLVGGLVPNVGLQVDSFLSTDVLDGDELIIIWAGANDAFGFTGVGFPPGNDPATAVDNMVDHISTLNGAGGETFLIPNVFDLGTIPGLVGTPGGDLANAWSSEFNALLETALDEVRDSLGATILHLDVNQLFDDIFGGANNVGITNFVDPACVDCDVFGGSIVVPNQDEYFWWDRVHPTRVVYETLGNAAAEFLGNELPRTKLSKGAGTINLSNVIFREDGMVVDMTSSADAESLQDGRADRDVWFFNAIRLAYHANAETLAVNDAYRYESISAEGNLDQALLEWIEELSEDSLLI